MSADFFRSLYALTWKNFALKKRHWQSTLLEFVIPLIYFFFNISATGFLWQSVPYAQAYFTSDGFYYYGCVLGILPMMWINLTHYVNFQIPKEKEINVANTLKIMNVSPYAYGLSFLLIQQPQQVFSWTIDFVSFLIGQQSPVHSDKFNVQVSAATLLFSESILLCSLFISNLSDNSLATSQIGTLMQFMGIAVFYLAIGRFGMDPFHSKDKFKFSTYLAIFLVSLGLYIISISIRSGRLQQRIRQYKAKRNLKIGGWSDEHLEEAYAGLLEENKKSIIGDLTPLLRSNIERKRVVQIRHVSKTMQGHRVIKDFSLDIYAGEILCLLGNNGSGKTTLINLLTGLIHADTDQGDVLLKINEKVISLKENDAKFRSYVRLCQQNDFLFEKLTVYEHLRLVCMLRGISTHKSYDSEIKNKVSEVNLHKDLHKLVKNISPGSRRKLSIAMSLIGDAKFVILDEPTSNLDLKSRERIWRLIKKISLGGERSILISTQHIEEAEVLGSRVCILVKGRKERCDTPDNIKRNFGSGFKVKVIAENNLHQLMFKEREGQLQEIGENHIQDAQVETVVEVDENIFHPLIIYLNCILMLNDKENRNVVMKFKQIQNRPREEVHSLPLNLL